MTATFVVFEGIDGSGKTTLSNRVAKALRERGLAVEHVREGGRFTSTTTQAIRELGRDARNLALTPRAELLLYAARDAQLLEEATRPALARADVVIADRYLYSAEVLARHGRGLAAEEVAHVIGAAGGGFQPDLVILVDIDPHVARARRRIAKIVTPDPRAPSRKGLAGAALGHRLRAGYRELAERDPSRWRVVDNSYGELDRLVDELTLMIETARGGAATAAPLASATAATPELPAVHDASTALVAFLAWIDRQTPREPALAAYFLGGLAGPGVDQRRHALAALVPLVVAAGLRGLDDESSWQLREQLADAAPEGIARSLGGLLLAQATGAAAERAERLRNRLEGVAPTGVLAAIDARDDDHAWALRDRSMSSQPDATVASVKRLDTARAWALRDAWLALRGGETALDDPFLAARACESVSGVAGKRAWELRARARGAAPVAAIHSTAGLLDERAWRWRSRWLERAPRAVMRSLWRLDDERAFAARTAVFAHCKEAIDSMVGLSGDAAWRLREAASDLWPSTVAKSLAPLTVEPRAHTLLARLLARHAGHVSLWKHAAGIALGAAVPMEER
ncbi:MAG: dTMP kinase [Myxococcales bacterium]|nr:dTMP kinase [Myxococcales bacterium]